MRAKRLQIALALWLSACSSTERVHELVLIPGPSQVAAAGQSTGGSGASGGASMSGDGGTIAIGGSSGTDNGAGSGGAAAAGVAGEFASGAGGVAGAGGIAGESSGGGSGLAGASEAGAGPVSCTDLDCGGGCPPCADGKKCLDDPDCISGACDAGTRTCVADQCSDHRQDGLETDADCGGLLCSPCTLKKHCLDSPDCLSVACDGISLRCVADQCADHRQDGTETDEDCGGYTCQSCAVGKKCKTNLDCQAGHVCLGVMKICQ